MTFFEGLLNWVQCFVRDGNVFDGADLTAVCLHRERQARTAGLAVYVNRATSANAMLAADMGPSKPKFMPQEVA